MLHVADFLGLWYSCSSVFYLIINPCILHQDWLNTLLGERKILQVFSLTGLQKSFCVIGVEVDWFPPIIDRSNASNLSKNSDKQYHFTEIKSITKKDTITPFMYYFQMQLVIHSPFYQSEVLGRMGRVDSCSEDSVLKSMSLSSMIGGTSLIEPLYTETNIWESVKKYTNNCPLSQSDN